MDFNILKEDSKTNILIKNYSIWISIHGEIKAQNQVEKSIVKRENSIKYLKINLI